MKFKEHLEKSREAKEEFFAGSKEHVQFRWRNANMVVIPDGEKNTRPSKTIPDQAMSIPEIMARYARGLPLGGDRVPVYDEDPENPMPDLSKMDIIDQHETIKAAANEMNELGKKFDAEEKAKKKEKEEAFYKSKWEKEKAEEQKNAGETKFNPAQKSGNDSAK